MHLSIFIKPSVFNDSLIVERGSDENIPKLAIKVDQNWENCWKQSFATVICNGHLQRFVNAKKKILLQQID